MEDIFDPIAEPENQDFPQVPGNNPPMPEENELTPEPTPEQPPEDGMPEQPLPEREPQYRPAQPSGGYRGEGSGRRESPFANSPYEMPHRDNLRYETEYASPEKPKSRPDKPHRGRVWKRILAAAAVLALVIASCALTESRVNSRWEARTAAMEDAFAQQLQELQEQMENLKNQQNSGVSVSGTPVSADGLSAAQIYAQNVNSVVLIESTVVSSYFGQSTTGISSGSGFILSENGYVVTNFHVVEGASSVSVKLYDGTKHPAALVGYDSTNDVAVLKIEAKGLDPVELGSSSDLIVGDQVVAIGNPLGELTATLTVGYVSAKERSVSTDGSIINMIQTDAAINSGNSGGPLFNMKGQVVGITTAKYSGASSSGATIEGIGFAIPMDDILEGIDQLIQYGYIKSAYLGVMVQNMDAVTADIYGLPVGAYVVSVENGYCAQKAGLQAKDIIIAVDDTTIENLTDLTRALRACEPGQEVALKVFRAGQILTLQVTLDERPADLDSTQPVQP